MTRPFTALETAALQSLLDAVPFIIGEQMVAALSEELLNGRMKVTQWESGEYAWEHIGPPRQVTLYMADEQ